VSITSNLQVQTLIQHLKNKNEWKEWQHQELVSYHKQGGSEDWFDEACASGVTCDVLIITGHYGGAFFGNKSGDAYLDSEKLKELSCKEKCENILRSPTEVYLFGCNTLAGKDGDTRTPEEYFRVLVEHGMDEAEARRSVALRFSEVGDSFKNYMQIAFHGNSALYGFGAPAPRSSRTAPLFGTYLQKLGSYNEHFEKTLEARLTGKVMQASQVFGETLKVDATQCNSLDSNNPRLKKLCELLYGESSLTSKVAMVSDLINEGLNENISVINQFFDSIAHDSQMMEELKKEPEFLLLMKNESLRSQILGALKSESPLVFSEGYKLANRLEFIETQAAKDLLSQKLSDWVGRDELSSEVLGDLCNKFPCSLKSIKDKSIFSSFGIYSIPSKLESMSKEVEDQLILAVKNPSLDKYDREHARNIILRVKQPSESSVKFVDSILPATSYSKDDEDYWEFADFFKNTPATPKAFNYFMSATSDQNRIYSILEVLEKANLSPEQKAKVKAERERYKEDEYIAEHFDKILSR